MSKRTRLDAILDGDNEDIRHPEDVARLKTEIPELRRTSDAEVQRIYSDWSESVFSAGWLGLDEDIISMFSRYLREEIPGSD